MKTFCCFVLNALNKTCKGFIEAEDAQSAKKLILAQGFSVLTIEEIKEVKTSKQLNQFDEVDDDYSSQDSGVDGPARSIKITPPTVKKTLNRHHLWILLFIILASLAAHFVLFVLPELTRALPDVIAAEYMTNGMSKKWDEQYMLLSKRNQSVYQSVDYYRKKMQSDWLNLSAGDSQQDPSGTGDVETAGEPFEIIPVVVNKETAEIKVLYQQNAKAREFAFLMVLERGQWKIDFVRDLQTIRNRLAMLADNPRDDVREKIIFEMENEYGFMKEELTKMIQQAKIQRIQRIRREILRAKETKETRLERQKKTGIVQTEFATGEANYTKKDNKLAAGEKDEIAEKLEEAIRMIDEIES